MKSSLDTLPARKRAELLRVVEALRVSFCDERPDELARKDSNG